MLNYFKQSYKHGKDEFYSELYEIVLGGGASATLTFTIFYSTTKVSIPSNFLRRAKVN